MFSLKWINFEFFVGSGGELFPPGQTKDKPIAIFSGELCRYLDLYFTEEVDINGLTVNKYSATERSLDNGEKYDEYECFSHGEETDIPSGVMNISACRYGAPVFVSLPHFYAADPYFLEYVDGLEPKKEKHEFYIALDGQTGVPIDVAARLQVNILVRPYPNIALYEEAPHIFFPIVWFEQKVRIPSDMIDEIKIAASIPNIGYACTGSIIVIGIILLIWIGYQQLKQQKMSKDVTHKEKSSLTNRNIIEIDRFTGKTPEQSPLMKRKSEIQCISEKESSAPLASTENDYEYSSEKIHLWSNFDFHLLPFNSFYSFKCSNLGFFVR